MPDEVRPGPISVRLPPELLEKLDKIAAALERSRSWVLLHAFKEYLKGEGDEVLEVQEGIEQLDRGESVSSEQLFAEMDEIIARAEAKRRAP
jgi:predicted transcriptional regulator